VPPAIFLPEQIERIVAAPFTPGDPARILRGGFEGVHSATMGYLLRDALLIDGVLYKGGSCEHLRPRQAKGLEVRIDEEFDRAAMISTPGGNRYFGQWLLDDCITYPLAETEGLPVMTNQAKWLHSDGYESWLNMSSKRVGNAIFRELILFDDVGQNASKKQRRDANRKHLLSHVDYSSHPGVFVLRGTAGERRVLINELEIAERLRNTRGFRLVDPMQMTVPEIVAACAGAKTVIGVEGSGLVHAVQLLGPGDNIVVLQPPTRFVFVFKDIADRDGQNFAFVVGTAVGEDFTIDVSDIEKTLDLLPVS
jgi:hypothetical protein